MGVLVEVDVAVGVAVGVEVEVGVSVVVGLGVMLGVKVAGGEPCRRICGLSHRASSCFGEPFARTTRMNFTV